MTHRAFHRQQGLSLWPLLIVLIVLAALAAAGWWGWQQWRVLEQDRRASQGEISDLRSELNRESQRRDRAPQEIRESQDRIEAARALYAVAACQERVRARSGQYDTTRCLDDADTEHYRVAITPPAQTSVEFYTATAVPSSPIEGDYCGSLILDQAGARRISGDPARTAACWSGR